MHHKDTILDALASRGNVAQFVGFRPGAGGPRQSYSRIAGHQPNELFLDADEAIIALIEASMDHSVNVRSYHPADPRSREFVYGLRNAEDAIAAVKRLTAEGLHTIVNETVDIHDGGISGVLQGQILEFSPDDTPRCVEKPGVTSVAFERGMAILEAVYGFRPNLDAIEGERTEFSIHPRPMGWKRTHTLLWEHETGVDSAIPASVSWPNNFSRLIGDKAFGLLVAHLTGAQVPRTLVISRRIAPFAFGSATGDCQVWTRTCPTEQQPGLYTTVKGWADPFALMQAEDPSRTAISSILSQAAVGARYSGAAIAAQDGELLIEGVEGEGDRFMTGEAKPAKLPESVIADIENLNRRLAATLGPVRFEWVHDGRTAWCVQLHRGTTPSTRSVIVEGEPAEWRKFQISDGLPALRALIQDSADDTGILLIGEVGITSHVADILRKAGRPSRIAHDS